MEEPEKLCRNCQRPIAVANFATHSAYCERNMKVCEICKNPYQASLEEDHLEEYHVVEPCNLCKRPVEKWLLPKHQDICPRRPIQCMFCELSFPFDEYNEHEDFCGSRTEKCLLCNKYIMLKDKKTHTELHRLERTIVRDSNSKREFDHTSVSEVACHSNSFNTEASVQSALLESLAQKNPEEVEQNMVNEAISLSSPYARGDTGERAVHLYSGRNKENTNATENEILKDKRDIGVAASNESTTGEISKHVTTCHICRQNIRWIDYNTHVPSCATDRGKCSSCGDDVPSGTMKEHLSRCRKIPRGVFAAEAGNKIDSKKSSSGSPQCTVPRSPVYPEIKYECPLCCEEVPEREKKQHESFYCKTLLEINQSDNLSSISEYDFSKESQRRISSEYSEVCSNRKQHQYKKSEQVQATRKGRPSNTHIEDYASKGAMPKHSNSSKVMMPKVGKCKYCYTVLNDNILRYHEDECVHQPIECSTCNDSIKLKDFEDHNCKWTKAKDKKNKKNNSKSKDSDNSNSGWFTSVFNRSSKLPEDERENGRRNVSHPKFTISRFSQTPSDVSSSPSPLDFSQTPTDVSSSPLYFSQPYVDAEIPCEFCGKLIPGFDIVLHETGCNPEAVSFAKQAEERKDERKVDQKQFENRSSAGISFFENRTAQPLPKKERAKRHQESSVKPGEFLSINRLESSSHIEDKKSESQLQLKKVSASTVVSLWNCNADDDETNATNHPLPSESPHEEKPHPIEDDKTVSEGSEKFDSGSDDEVSQMLDFIKNEKTEHCVAQPNGGSEISKSANDSSSKADDELHKRFYENVEHWKKVKSGDGSKLSKSKDDSSSGADEEVRKRIYKNIEHQEEEKLYHGSRSSKSKYDSFNGTGDELGKMLYEKLEQYEVEGASKLSKSKDDSSNGADEELWKGIYKNTEHQKEEKLSHGSRSSKSKYDSFNGPGDGLGKMYEKFEQYEVEGASKLSKSKDDSSSGEDEELCRRIYKNIEHQKEEKLSHGSRSSKSKYDSFSGPGDELSKMLDEKIDYHKVEGASKLSESKDDISSRLDGYNFSMNQGRRAPSPHGAAVGSESEESPFKEAFDYILNSKEECLVEERTCWNPSSIDDDDARESVKVNLNEDLKVQESFSTAHEEDKRWKFLSDYDAKYK